LDTYADVALVNSIGVVPKILEVACRMTGAGFAGVARVTEDRWIACTVRDEIAFGLAPGTELPLDNTFCRDVKQSRRELIIENAADDERYAANPMSKMFGVQSYISVPIILADDTFFGTLCAIDRRPARLNTPETVTMFTLLAELIAYHLDATDRFTRSQASLANALEVSEIREQFIAVLGHDLRNPLGAIALGASLLHDKQKGPREVQIVDLIQKSVGRMTEMIGNVLDFARGRLGAGLTMSPDAENPLQPVLEHVVAELRMAWPDRVIETDYAPVDLVFCDRDRIGQLFSNLLGNALTYGLRDEPVRVRTRNDGGLFELSVANAGKPISALAMRRLFQPFVRGEVTKNQQGLGLGLYIASEIARAHEGTLTVSSDDGETCFTLRIPSAAEAAQVPAIAQKALSSV
jgi:signal transduction histidine kinase